MESEPAVTCPSTKIKHDWYQTDSHVVITIFVKNAIQENVKIEFTENRVNACIKLPQSDSEYILDEILYNFIKPEESSYKILSTKIEIKLKKQAGFRWESLKTKGPQQEIKKFVNPEETVTTEPTRYPSSAIKKHDWDRLEAEMKKEEENEKPEGDAALNQLFQKIYSDGSEEVRRAMNKSFMESGGTVLSTNWKEVGEKSVEVKAPDGMEWKNWEK